jgi:cytochrome b
LIGTTHARFSNFIFPPRVVFTYLKDLVTFKAKRYIGHGPAGGSMVILLLISLLITTLTGLTVYGGKEYAGPLAGIMAGADNIWVGVAKETHEFFAGFTIILICLHVAGILFSSFVHRENLIRAMFTGYKRPEDTHLNIFTENDRHPKSAAEEKTDMKISGALIKSVGVIMKDFLILTTVLMGFAFSAWSAQASAVDDLLAKYRQQGVGDFSASSGQTLWNKSFTEPASGESRRCTSCHTTDLRNAGKQAKTGKAIDPMAPSVNPKRLTDGAFIEKWFMRNCKWTLGRECTPFEKGNFLIFLKNQ